MSNVIENFKKSRKVKLHRDGSSVDNAVPIQGGQLPELVVTLAPWQKKLRKGIKERRVRKAILKDITSKLEHDIPQDLSRATPEQKKKLEELEQSARYWDSIHMNDFVMPMNNLNRDDWSKIYHSPEYQEAEQNWIKTRDDIRNYKKHISNNKVNPYNAYYRFYKVWKEAGKPKLEYDGDLIAQLYGFLRNASPQANMNPITNVATNIQSFDEAMAELAHPIQYKVGRYNNPIKIAGQQFLRPFVDVYDTNGYFEHETHELIEPMLKDYILKGTPFIYNGQRIFE